jgi:hypothetical protein
MLHLRILCSFRVSRCPHHALNMWPLAPETILEIPQFTGQLAHARVVIAAAPDNVRPPRGDRAFRAPLPLLCEPTAQSRLRSDVPTVRLADRYVAERSRPEKVAGPLR